MTSRTTDNLHTWQPIETVPRSESMVIPERVLLWCSEAGPDGKPEGIRFGYAYARPSGGFVAKGEGMHGNWAFTHWMPLPAPPESESNGSSPINPLVLKGVGIP